MRAFLAGRAGTIRSVAKRLIDSNTSQAAGSVPLAIAIRRLGSQPTQVLPIAAPRSLRADHIFPPLAVPHRALLSTSSWAPVKGPSPPSASMQPQGSRKAQAEAELGPQAGAPAVRIAVGQMTATGDQAANFATCERLAKAAAAGCRMLFLPECFSFIGESQPESVAAAQPLDGPLMGQYRQLARSVGLWMSLGGFQEVGPDPQHIYNTHVVLDSSGELVAQYRKIHLFDVDVPNGPILMESRSTAPGNEAVVVDTPAGRLGLTTCYDLRFPELFAHLTWERGAQILAVPSAFTVVTGAAHWEVLLRARAIECQSYVVAAAQAGRHNTKRESYGDALIVDPWGTVVARLTDPRVTGIAVAEVDPALLARTRERMPCQLHREKGRAAYVGKS
ncbi:hypothetical protein PLESTF_001289500 [Pleodorina starrii]|nr:hypothetical protein PLESTF_001289500 [Pleodorina starrii]